MTRRLIAAAAASAFVLAGCISSWPWDPAPAAKAPPTAPVETPASPPETAAFDAVTESCGLLASRGWEAWINKMPGPGMQPKVHVTGKVDARTGGYTFSWAEGPLERSATPALRLRLIPKAPDGMATTAITTETVTYEAPALDAGYSRVIISCGPVTLAEIRQITVAQ